MATKPFRLEVEYFGLKVSREVEKLDDLVGLTLALGPFVKIGIRDLTPSASIHTTVALYQPTQGSKPPPFSKTIEGGDGTLLLVPVVSANVGWRRIIINGNAQAASANANASLSSQMPNPPFVAGYDARRNVFLRGALQSGAASVNVANSNKNQPSSPDFGIGSSNSSNSEESNPVTYRMNAPPILQREVAKRGRPFGGSSSGIDKRFRRE